MKNDNKPYLYAVGNAGANIATDLQQAGLADKVFYFGSDAEDLNADRPLVCEKQLLTDDTKADIPDTPSVVAICLGLGSKDDRSVYDVINHFIFSPKQPLCMALFCTLPFKLEGKKKREEAEWFLDEIIQESGLDEKNIFVFDNEKFMKSHPEASLSDMNAPIVAKYQEWLKKYGLND